LRALEAKPEQVAANESDSNVAPVGAPPSEAQPAYKKWWVWTIVAVVAAGGATTAALLLTRDKKTQTTAVEGTNTPKVSLQTLRTLETF
jgi:hypothetical protein